jgi:arsenite methyltransferase
MIGGPGVDWRCTVWHLKLWGVFPVAHDNTLATTNGHYLSEASWLDTHYEVARIEYEDALRSVGIKPGWNVLDAGCGAGGFLPLMCELVGADGVVTALDLAPENVKRVDALVSEGRIPRNVQTCVGSMLSLPFENATFDCVWSGNVMQYMSDAEVAIALAEFKRVLKPAGTLAAKEFDLTMAQLLPVDPGLIARFLSMRRAQAVEAGIRGPLLAAYLPADFRRAGFADVWRRSYLVERWAPLEARTRTFVGTMLDFWLPHATSSAALPADRQAWQDISANRDELFGGPDFCYREGFVLAVGRAPD